MSISEPWVTAIVRSDVSAHVLGKSCHSKRLKAARAVWAGVHTRCDVATDAANCVPHDWNNAATTFVTTSIIIATVTFGFVPVLLLHLAFIDKADAVAQRWRWVAAACVVATLCCMVSLIVWATVCQPNWIDSLTVAEPITAAT